MGESRLRFWIEQREFWKEAKRRWIRNIVLAVVAYLLAGSSVIANAWRHNWVLLIAVVIVMVVDVWLIGNGMAHLERCKSKIALVEHMIEVEKREEYI